jgi:hypothetical protein
MVHTQKHLSFFTSQTSNEQHARSFSPNKLNSSTIEFWKEWKGDVTAGRLNSEIDNWRKQSIQ